jgi:hypothetical protein
METIQPETAQATEEQPTCWCCGGVFAEDDLVRLGCHSEVGLCFRCARWVQRRAAEQAAAGGGGLAAQYRGMFGTARGWVLRHDMQDKPVIGRLVRALNRLLP